MAVECAADTYNERIDMLLDMGFDYAQKMQDTVSEQVTTARESVSEKMTTVACWLATLC